MITIVPLSKAPQHLPTVAHWIFTEWPWYFEPDGEPGSLRYQQDSLENTTPPCTWIALRDETLIGTIALIVADLEPRPQYSPWLGSLYVVPTARGQGVAKQLICFGVEQARALKIPRLYTWTRKLSQVLQRSGWDEIERLQYQGAEVVVHTINPALPLPNRD
jgi:N-acetylglutamate synthase-like GNAT family acetyltransferase